MQDYTIKDFRVGNFEDTNGNTWCTVTFAEYGEPLIWVVKDPEKTPERFSLDTKAFGEIKDWTSSKGKTSPRFYAKQKDDRQTISQSSSSNGVKDSYLKDMSNTPILMYNGSLNYAKELGLNLITNQEDRRVYFEYVKEITDEMLNMIEAIRGSGEAAHLSSPGPAIKDSPVPSATSLGDKFRARQVSSEHDYGEPDG